MSELTHWYSSEVYKQRRTLPRFCSMTTLRNFQNEIDDIHHREMSKQRTKASLDKEKEQKLGKGKAKEDHGPTDTKASSKSVQSDAGPGRSQEVEERIMVSQDFNHVSSRYSAQM